MKIKNMTFLVMITLLMVVTAAVASWSNMQPDAQASNFDELSRAAAAPVSIGLPEQCLGDVYSPVNPSVVLAFVGSSSPYDFFWRETILCNEAWILPDPPAGYQYAYAPGYTGFFDVFAFTADGVSISIFEPLSLTVCFVTPEVGASFVVGEYTDIPRAWQILPTSVSDGWICGSATNLGQFALLAQ